MDSLVEIVEKQNELVRKQSKIIDELFRLLLQHVEVEELCNLQAYAEIKDVAAEIKRFDQNGKEG